jgi:hypothetical protein
MASNVKINRNNLRFQIPCGRIAWRHHDVYRQMANNKNAKYPISECLESLDAGKIENIGLIWHWFDCKINLIDWKSIEMLWKSEKSGKDKSCFYIALAITITTLLDYAWIA